MLVWFLFTCAAVSGTAAVALIAVVVVVGGADALARRLWRRDDGDTEEYFMPDFDED